MPTKLKVLTALMVLSVGLDLVTEKWVVAVLHGLLLLGVIKGNEGVRSLLMLLAMLGLISGVVVLAMGAVAFGTGYKAMFIFASGLLGMAQAGFMLWCLRQEDVQRWMFHRSLDLEP